MHEKKGYILIKICLFFLFGAMLLSCSQKQTKTAEEQMVLTDNRLEWFRKAKFGLFIHWGIYSVPGGEYNGNTNYAEWIMMRSGIPAEEYVEYAKKFNPKKFNPDDWAKLASDAGMNYMVFTAKHHDGFCMYDSKLTEFDIMDASPYKKDIVKALSEACAKEDIRFCTYYSIVDWHHPEFPQKYSQVRDYEPKGFHGFPNPDADISKYASYMKGQLDEILSNYGPIDIMWFDGGSSFLNYSREELLNTPEIVKLIHEKQPRCLINNRLGDDFSDYGTPEQEIPDRRQTMPFEVCMTMTPNNHWGYNKHDTVFHSAKTIISRLVDIVGKGGNFLLNVGPSPEGVIPEKPTEILREVGTWLKANEESIYETYASPEGTYSLYEGEITWKTDKAYLHVLNWPENQKLNLYGLKWKIENIYPLNDKSKTPLEFVQYDRMVFIDVPEKPYDDINSVLVVELEENSNVYN